MSKNHDEGEEESVKHYFTDEHINKFREEFNKYKSDEAFYVDKGFIRINEFGNWVVIKLRYIYECPITGMLAGDIPFTFYRRLQFRMEQVDRRIENAKQRRAEQYAKGDYPEATSHNAYAH